MQFELSATRFPNTKHLRLIIEGIESNVEALTWLLVTFLMYQTDALSGIWNANTKTLTMQGFVHSGENC